MSLLMRLISTPWVDAGHPAETVGNGTGNPGELRARSRQQRQAVLHADRTRVGRGKELAGQVHAQIVPVVRKTVNVPPLAKFFCSWVLKTPVS